MQLTCTPLLFAAHAAVPLLLCLLQLMRWPLLKKSAHIQACKRVIKFIPSLQEALLLLCCCAVEELASDIRLHRSTHSTGALAAAAQ